MQYMNALLSFTESEDPSQVFQILETLGRGAYGSVHKALHRKTNEYYAIKILPATSINEVSSIKKQIAILRECNSEFIVKYYGSYLKENDLWIVMEYCMAGSITDIVNITQKDLNQSQIASILELVLKGLSYLHSNKKIHRDVKGANILLNDQGVAKLADFGVSTEMMHTNARQNTHIGSPYWMSPEVIKYSAYNQKTDIWSLGITAIELAEGIVPYSHLKPFMAMWTMRDKPVQSFKEPQKWSVEFQEFIKECLQIDPEKRPSADILLSHEFITRHSKGSQILKTLVDKSMQEIEKYRSGQYSEAQMEDHENSQHAYEGTELELEKGFSNNEEAETQTVIHRNKSVMSSSDNNYAGSNLKSFQGSGGDSVIEYSAPRERNSHQNFSSSSGFGQRHCFDSHQSEDDELKRSDDCGSVIFKGDLASDNGHSRQCSVVSVSSVVVNNDVEGNTNQTNSNYLLSYIQNMQNQQQKQEQMKKAIQSKVESLEKKFLEDVESLYEETKRQVSQLTKQAQKLYEIPNEGFKSKAEPLDSEDHSLIKSPLASSKNVYDYILNSIENTEVTEYKRNLSEGYLAELEREWRQSQIKKQKNVMISLIDQMDNTQEQRAFSGQFVEAGYFNHTESYGGYRKKSQSSSIGSPDSPSSVKRVNCNQMVQKGTIFEEVDANEQQQSEDLPKTNQGKLSRGSVNKKTKSTSNKAVSESSVKGTNKCSHQSTNNSKVGIKKQMLSNSSSINRLIEKEKQLGTTIVTSHQLNHPKYKEILISSEKFPNLSVNSSLQQQNRSLGMSTNSYVYPTPQSQEQLGRNTHTEPSANLNKRVITTEPHDSNFYYEEDSVSTNTRNMRNFKQFMDDPTVMNNLKKQLTQPSQGSISEGHTQQFRSNFYPNTTTSNLQQHSDHQNAHTFNKQTFTKDVMLVKSNKSKEKTPMGGMRQKERATHIAHTTIASKERAATNNSSKKLKTVKGVFHEEGHHREKSPEETENNHSKNRNKSKKAKSKNKQTASTTIPFGSGTMPISEFFPGKLNQSKDNKKAANIPAKSGPFSKVKTRN